MPISRAEAHRGAALVTESTPRLRATNGKGIQMKFVDTKLARRLEAAEDMPQVAIAQQLQWTNPEIGAEVLDIAGGHATFTGKTSVVGRAVGMGLCGPVSAAELDQVEAFYKKHEIPAQVDITPVTDGSLLELLKARGYVIAELNNVLARELKPEERFNEEAPGFEFRAFSLEQTELWTQTMLRGFFPDGGVPENLDKVLAPMATMPRSLATLVWRAGEAGKAGAQPVGCCGGFLSSEHGMIALGGTSTVAECRGRGIQTAAIGRRLNIAIKEGYNLAVIVTQGNTTSMRNAERMGFSLAYSKATVVKAFGND